MMVKRRRVWRRVIGIHGARVLVKDARAEVRCRCGALVVLGVWDAVERCAGCGRCFSLVCSVKEEVSNDG